MKLNVLSILLLLIAGRMNCESVGNDHYTKDKKGELLFHSVPSWTFQHSKPGWKLICKRVIRLIGYHLSVPINGISFYKTIPAGYKY